MATTQTTRIGPADHGRRMSLDEFREAEEQEGYRYELARGVLEVTQVPGDSHGQIVDNLHQALSRYRLDHPRVIRRIGHGSDVRYVIPGAGSDRHPDLAIVFRGAALDDQRNLRAALAIEVVSPGERARRRDYEDKRGDYLLVGIVEYWIVDPKSRRVTVLAREDGGDGPAWRERLFVDDEPITSDLLPGFAGRVADLWMDAESDEDDD